MLSVDLKLGNLETWKHLADKRLTDCASSIGSTGAAAASSDCSMTCSGNSTEICGGSNRVSIFWNGKSRRLALLQALEHLDLDFMDVTRMCSSHSMSTRVAA